MTKTLTAIICGCLIVAVASLALANGAPERSTVSRVGGTVYKGGAQILDRSGMLVNSCLKTSFGLFNPCLDFVKGCTTRVLSPLDKGFGYAESTVAKQWPKKKTVRAPEAGKAAPQKQK
jgi:hypothetical protein